MSRGDKQLYDKDDKIRTVLGSHEFEDTIPNKPMPNSDEIPYIDFDGRMDFTMDVDNNGTNPQLGVQVITTTVDKTVKVGIPPNVKYYKVY